MIITEINGKTARKIVCLIRRLFLKCLTAQYRDYF